MKVIYTKRYILKKVELTDVCDIFDILKDKETIKYLNLPAIVTINDVEKLVLDYLEENKCGNKYPFAIHDKKTNELLGVFLIKLDLFDEDCYEFTVYIKKNYWNIGIYSEVLPFMIEFTFNEINTNNFRGFVMQGNTASSKVLIKNSFKLEKIFKVDSLPTLIESYLITKNDYEELKNV